MTVTQRAKCARIRTGASLMVLVLLGCGGQALAQEAAGQADEPTEVVVTGYRKSVESAVNTKRRASNIVDVIKADDMASFPDANLAESIQRIPGVSITRDGGEGRSITVRGLGSDFTRTTLNGVEAYSATTGSTLGVMAGINRTRGFDFSTFASELFNSVTVNKSQAADMDEGSLGATIDLQTGRPFDKSGFRMAASAQAAYYDNNKTTSPRVAGLISNTWDTSVGQIGALLSVAYSERLMQEDGYSDTSASDYSDANNGFCGVAVDDPNQAGSQVVNTSIPYVNPLSGTGSRPAGQCFSGLPSNAAAYAKINQPNVFLPRNPGLGRFELNQKRLGVTSAFQWRPNDNTRFTLDAVYSKFDQNRQDYALSNASNNRNVNGASAAFPLFAGRVDSQIMDVNVTSSGQVDYMKLNHVDIKHIAEYAETTTTTYMLGLHGEHTFSDKLRGDFRIAQSRSEFDQPLDVFISYDAFNKDGYVWDARADARRPFINYGYDVANVANVTFTNAGTGLTPDVRIVHANVKNTLSSLEGNLHYDILDGLTFHTGFLKKKYEFTSTQTQRVYGNNTSPAAKTDGKLPFEFTKFAADFPNLGTLSTVLTGWGEGLELPAGSVSSWVVPDVQAFISKLDLNCNCINSYGDWTLGENAVRGGNALANNRAVAEDDTALYGMVSFEEDLARGMRLRGNAGLRYVKTEVTATGYAGTTLATVTHSYDDYLPALNLALEVTPTFTTRFAFAGVMSRPFVGSLTPGGTVNTTFGVQSVNIGNPFLNPYRAKNYDLSLEWYPTRSTLLSATLFYKDIASMIQSITSIEPYSNTGLPLSLLSAGQDASTPYTVTRTRNTEGGYIKGVELSLVQPFTFLPSPFNDFGTQINYTWIDSSVLYYLSAGTATTAPTTTRDQFVNVSPNSVNATLYYEKGPFEARVSVAYRDEYITALPFKSELLDANGSYATTNVDMSASYKLSSKLSINLDALNLTNQMGDQWSGKERRAQRVFSNTGRQIFFGVSYTF